MEKKTFGYVLFAVAVIALVVIIVANPPKKEVETPVTETPAVENLNVLKKEDKKIAKETERLSIDVTYPEFEGVPAVINSDIKNFAESEVANIESMKLEEIPTMSDAMYFLKIGYEIEQANTNFVSLVFSANIYTGGAHPNQYYKTFNYNVDLGKPATLADLYPEEKDALATLKPKIKKAVHDTLAAFFASQGDTTTDPDTLLFEDISDLGAETFQNFTFGTAYINFYFSPYDIAPYAVGPIVAKVQR
jgi:hypothetical protein